MMQNILTAMLILMQLISPLTAQEERIVFSSDRNGNFDIYSMRPDGTDLKQLTNHPSRDAWPKWSPDGKQIIFCSERFGKNQIMLMDADGENQRNISNNSENELDPVISPDGKQIAFINKETGSYQLHVMDIDGKNRKILTNKGPFCGRADWSPDSKRLVYLSRETGAFEVWRIDADGNDTKQLTQLKTGAGSPSWSKHGYYIMFHAHEKEEDKLFRMKPDGSELTRISKSGNNDFQGRWSGHYNRIVYTSNRDGNYEIYQGDMNGNFDINKETRLTRSGANDSMPDWFVPAGKPNEPIRLVPPIPDNLRIAFTSYQSGSADVYLMKPEGTGIQKLTHTDDANSFARDAGDGQSIIFRRAPSESGYVEKFLKVNFKTGNTSAYETRPIVEGAKEESINSAKTHTAYAKEINGFRELFLYDHRQKKHHQITDHSEQKIQAMIQRSWWSHNGQKLAFLAGKDYYNLYLRIHDLQTGKTRTVTSRGYMFSGVVWLRGDTSFVVNIKIKDITTYELWSIDETGANLKQLTDNPGRGSAHPALSPDGQWIAFESGRDMDDGEIYLMRPDGSAQTRITYHPSYEGRPAWITLK